MPQTAELETLFEALGFDSAILEALHRTIIEEVWPCERYFEESLKCLDCRLYGRELPKCSEIFQRSVCEFAEKHADPENILITLSRRSPKRTPSEPHQSHAVDSFMISIINTEVTACHSRNSMKSYKTSVRLNQSCSVWCRMGLLCAKFCSCLTVQICRCRNFHSLFA